MNGPLRLAVLSQKDADAARRAAGDLALALGLSPAMAYAVKLIASELGTNLVRYGEAGEMTIAPFQATAGQGIEVVSRDQGPGIVDVDLALQDGYSTSHGLGSGLGSVRRLADEFTISSGPAGTTIGGTIWVRPT